VTGMMPLPMPRRNLLLGGRRRLLLSGCGCRLRFDMQQLARPLRVLLRRRLHGRFRLYS